MRIKSSIRTKIVAKYFTKSHKAVHLSAVLVYVFITVKCVVFSPQNAPKCGPGRWKYEPRCKITATNDTVDCLKHCHGSNISHITNTKRTSKLHEAHCTSLRKKTNWPSKLLHFCVKTCTNTVYYNADKWLKLGMECYGGFEVCYIVT